MSEEEAIKTIKKYIELIDKGYCDDCNELECIDNFGSRAVVKAMETVLNMIEEKNSEIHRYKGNEEFYIEELKKRDKIINKIAEQLVGLAVYEDDAKDLTDITILADKEEIIKYFEKKVENKIQEEN